MIVQQLISMHLKRRDKLLDRLLSRTLRCILHHRKTLAVEYT